MATYLVCEYALDGRVLNELVIQRHNLNVQIVLAGGNSGLGPIRGYLAPQSSSNVALTIRDRDYDRSLADANATWANPNGRGFIWRRHEIENYLLHPQVVLSFFNEVRAAPKGAWANTLPTTEADVSTLLEQLATPFLDNHAAGVLRSELVRQINLVGSLSYGPTSPSPQPGANSPTQAEWLPVLIAEANRLRSVCVGVNSLPHLQSADITARYATLLTQCHDPAFLTTGDFLREMGGKELVAALSRQLHGLGARGLDKDQLADKLVAVLSRIYSPNTLFQPDDFSELANILGQY